MNRIYFVNLFLCVAPPSFDCFRSLITNRCWCACVQWFCHTKFWNRNQCQFKMLYQLIDYITRSNTFVEYLSCWLGALFFSPWLAATTRTHFTKVANEINKIWNWHYFLISRLIYVPLITDCRRNQIDLSCFFWGVEFSSHSFFLSRHVDFIFILKFVFKWMETKIR